MSEVLDAGCSACEQSLLGWKVGTDMEDLVPVAALVTNFVAIVSLLLIWRQLRLNRKNGRYLALTNLHEQVLDPDMQRALRTIYSTSPQRLARPADENELVQIEMVLNKYDLIGSRIKMGLIPEKDAMQTEWSVALRLKQQLWTFIQHEQGMRPGIPYKPGFMWLINSAESYRRRHYKDVAVAPFSRVYSQGSVEEGEEGE